MEVKAVEDQSSDAKMEQALPKGTGLDVETKEDKSSDVETDQHSTEVQTLDIKDNPK